MSIRQYSRNSEESEKQIERYLCQQMKLIGGLALKYFNPHATGYPDRLLLFPDGSVWWAEIKSKGKHPTLLQSTRIARLREDLRQIVYVVDSRQRVNEIITLWRHIRMQ